MTRWLASLLLLGIAPSLLVAQDGFEVINTPDSYRIVTPELEAVVRKQGYVTGVAGGTLLDKQTGFRDLGFGLDVVDWLMEPGSDETYRDQLDPEMVYEFGNEYHGDIPKRSLEGPQICTQAKELEPEIIRGKDFVAVKLQFRYRTAAPGKKTGSLWEQTLVFPRGKRYFFSSDKITSVNDGEATFLRIDMPGHIKHQKGDTFSEVYLSYQGTIPSSEFVENFAPDDKFRYVRDEGKIPERIIRGYRIRDPKSGRSGPWLAGMTLEPSLVSEAWCHQRGYVCMIEEFWGRPIRAGQSFSAAFVVGFFDSIEEMQQVYDQHRGATGIVADEQGWELVRHEPNRLVIEILDAQTLKLDGERLEFRQLPERLAARIGGKDLAGEMLVEVRAKPSTPSGAVVGVMSVLQQQGVKKTRLAQSK